MIRDTLSVPRGPFCPTGGIMAANYRDDLAMNNLACVGGFWIVASDLVDDLL